jgi:hypothetical protein
MKRGRKEVPVPPLRPGDAAAARDNFLILTFFSKLFLKIIPQKHYSQI